ncbi:hypothetical protein Gohar_007977, partial [Gossypium harknessii]|nr:hypothetical protein [Gossypium harknessii]
KVHGVVLGNNNNSLIIPYYFTQQFDLDEAITVPENPQAGQEEVAGLVSDRSSVVVFIIITVLLVGF